MPAAVTGRRYVITGSASGIGAATAARLRAEGAHVIGIDVGAADIVADLGTSDGRRHTVAAMRDAIGPAIDAVIACAGTTERSPSIVRVNYLGITDLLQRLQVMLAAGSDPRVVVVSSLAAIHPVDQTTVTACLSANEGAAVAAAEQAIAKGNSGLLYASTKQALSRWVRASAARQEWAGAGIALNAVCPGTVRTPMTEDLLADPESRRMLDTVVPMPLGGYLSPQTVAGLLTWLAAPDNTHITG